MRKAGLLSLQNSFLYTILLCFFIYTDAKSQNSISLETISAKLVMGPGINEEDTVKTVGHPMKIRFDNSDNLYILDYRDVTTQGRLYKFDKDLRTKTLIGNVGQGPGEYIRPIDFCLDDRGNVYILDLNLYRISVFNQYGINTNTIKLKTLNWASSFAVSALGEAYVCNAAEQTLITVYSSNGRLLKEFGNPYTHKRKDVQLRWNIASLEFDKENNLLISFNYKPVIRKYNTSGTMIFEKQISGPEMENAIKETKPIPETGPVRFMHYVFDMTCVTKEKIIITLWLSQEKGLLYELSSLTGETTRRVIIDNVRKGSRPLLTIANNQHANLIWGASNLTGCVYQLSIK